MLSYQIRRIIMASTIYKVGLFVLAILLWLEPIFHIRMPWELKRGVRSVIFLAYVIIGIYFDLL